MNIVNPMYNERVKEFRFLIVLFTPFRLRLILKQLIDIQIF